MDNERKQLASVKNLALTHAERPSGGEDSGDESLRQLVEELTKPENRHLLILINNMAINMQDKQDSKSETLESQPHRYDECIVCQRETFNHFAGIYYFGAVYCPTCKGSLCQNHVIRKTYWFKATEEWCSICGCALVGG